MDKFRVGQKVRIIDSKFCPQYVGMICTITGKREWCNNQIYGHTWLGYKVDFNILYNPKEEHLEPVYDGDEASNWSECIWKPHKVEA